MKRRSMIGRRQSRLLQSPAPATYMPPPAVRNAQTTPEPPRRSPDPFRTPSVNSSLSDIASNRDPWSVFKNVRGALKSPTHDTNGFGGPQHDDRRDSVLRANYNRRKEQKLNDRLGLNSSIASKKFDFPVYKSQRKTMVPDEGNSNPQLFTKPDRNREPLKRSESDPTETRSSAKTFLFPIYKNQVNPMASVPEKDGESASVKPAFGGSDNQSSPWEQQDLRKLSPPWSKSLDTFIDLNLKTPAKGASSPEEIDLNLRTEPEKPGLLSWSTTSWVPRAPHITEAPVATAAEPHQTIVDKENLAPDHLDGAMDEESQPSDETFLTPSQTSSSPSKTLVHDIKRHFERLAELNSKIEAAEDKRNSWEQKIRELEKELSAAAKERSAAEDERTKLEYERRMLSHEVLEQMSQAPSVYQQSSKRMKLSTPVSAKKKRPSIVASKILKKDFRTPARKPAGNVTMNSFLNPFTPRSLRKNINDQYDMIFGN